MTTCYLNKLTLAIGLSSSIFFTPLFASEATDTTEPLALRKIMQNLNENMQAITHSISHEDWAQVEKIAPQVADHPQPPLLEKIRILSYVGSNITEFKNHDGKTHAAANALAQAASTADGEAVISAFARLQTTCLNCHQKFRHAFVEHFYPQEN
ncbi:MAG: cytochrome c [Gammaproteobacteria bacterium]|nr:cytochrome c [Gammaproteobacteria bacterium]